MMFQLSIEGFTVPQIILDRFLGHFESFTWSHKIDDRVIFENFESPSGFSTIFLRALIFFNFRWLKKIFEMCYHHKSKKPSGYWLGEAPAQRVWSKTQYSSKYRQNAIPPPNSRCFAIPYFIWKSARICGGKLPFLSSLWNYLKMYSEAQNTF